MRVAMQRTCSAPAWTDSTHAATRSSRTELLHRMQPVARCHTQSTKQAHRV